MVLVEKRLVLALSSIVSGGDGIMHGEKNLNINQFSVKF